MAEERAQLYLAAILVADVAFCMGAILVLVPENAAQRDVSAVGQPIEPPTKPKLVASMEAAEAVILRTRACCSAP